MKIAVVDYEMGNLFSVKQACQSVGLDAFETGSKEDILSSDGVILPGVGAFGHAMTTLRRMDLVSVLRDYVASGKPLLGICLGMQLLMTESHEFGLHQGLGLVEGEVIPLENPREGSRRLKVPEVGWNRLHPFDGRSWAGSLLAGLPPGVFMYFVHSFYAQPRDLSSVLSNSHYGQIKFCSSLRKGNITACQFHPERSGPMGLRVYSNFAAQVASISEVKDEK